MFNFNMNNSFKKLEISDWKQFKQINIEFHDRLTILTGANGSGKTTILDRLADHWGWHKEEIAGISKNKEGLYQFVTRLWHQIFGVTDDPPSDEQRAIGTLEYTDGDKAKLLVPYQTTPNYKVQIEGKKNDILGFYIQSHRPPYRYKKLSQFETSTKSSEHFYNQVIQDDRHIYIGGVAEGGSRFVKEGLLNWSILGYGNERMPGNPEILKYLSDYENILKQVLPKSLGFQKIAFHDFEVVFKCQTENFLLDSASGGIAAIIDLSWRIFLFSQQHVDGFTILIDEVENHLHPTLQREILPNLLETFPKVKFIVSTHSPLIVGSVKDSAVYVLKYELDEKSEKQKVISEALDLINKAKTASETLTDVLGLPLTVPLWAENEIEKIVSQYTNTKLDEINYDEFKNELKKSGIEDLVPLGLQELISKHHDKN